MCERILKRRTRRELLRAAQSPPVLERVAVSRVGGSAGMAKSFSLFSLMGVAGSCTLLKQK